MHEETHLITERLSGTRGKDNESVLAMQHALDGLLLLVSEGLVAKAVVEQLLGKPQLRGIELVWADALPLRRARAGVSAGRGLHGQELVDVVRIPVIEVVEGVVARALEWRLALLAPMRRACLSCLGVDLELGGRNGRHY